tara:strand:+ start:108 stop:1751 length:1644 start_codon:yes stop_codon:yes gene_type:complete
MAYKQNNPLSRKSSPLKHNVLDPRGGVWPHDHGQVEPGQYWSKKNPDVDLSQYVSGYAHSPKIIKGSSNFGVRPNRAVVDDTTGTKRLTTGERATEANYARDYANTLADMYNTGQLTGGNFLAEDFYKRPSKLSIKGGKVKVTPRYKSVRGGSEGLSGQHFNLNMVDDPSQWVAPETQFTGDQLYDMMLQGGGLISLGEGGWAAGNPNQALHDEYSSLAFSPPTDIDGNIIQGSAWDSRVAGADAWEAAGKPKGDFSNRGIRDTYDTTPIGQGSHYQWDYGDQDPNMYLPTGYTLADEGDERFIVNEEVVEEEPKNIADILAARQRGPSRKSSKEEPFYRRSSKSSPLNQVDPRVGEALPGYDYTSEIGEKVLVTDPVTGEKYWNTPTTYSGTMNVPGVEEVPGIYEPGTPGGTPVNPNPDNLPQEVLDQNWTNFCLENPTDPRCQGFNERMGITLPPTEVPTNEVLSDQYITNLREPYIEEEIIEEEEYNPNPFGLSGGSLKGKGFEFTLPQLEMMSLPQLRAAKSKCGSCKSAGLINVLLGRRSG